MLAYTLCYLKMTHCEGIFDQVAPSNYVKTKILIIFFYFLPSNNMFCNVHVSTVHKKILSDAFLVLDKSIVHIHLSSACMIFR